MKSILAAMLLALVLINATYAYTVTIHAPAVLSSIDKGTLTTIMLNITAGNGTVYVGTGGSGTVAQDTLASADTAVMYATSSLSINESRYNYRYTIESNGSNVSGPSAGLAMTLLAIGGLEHRQLNQDFTVTGTISPNGTVGQIGGVFDKVQAASSIRAHYILVPAISTLNYQYPLYYLSQQAYSVPVIEVANVTQALPFAFGSPAVTLLNYSIPSTDYYASGLPSASPNCTSCNYTSFGNLMNFTFNFTQSQINAINGTDFGPVKSQLQSQLDQYRAIGSKGYLYSAADLAFNEYPVAFMFSNYRNSTYPDAIAILDNISAYCSSVQAPPITNTNYEYVFGGQARVTWAEITLQNAYQQLNASQTSDAVLLTLEGAAPAYSWCLAAGQMYNTASGMGGNYTVLNPSVSTAALQAVQSLSGLGNGLYINASRTEYASGEYGAALYSAKYAQIFYNGSNNAYPSVGAVNATVAKALEAPNGIWPQQFALQSKFYLYEASVSNSTVAPQYLDNAYTTALLSVGLGDVNTYIGNNLSPSTVPYNIQNLTAQLSQLQYEMSLTLGALIVVVILLALVLCVLLMMLSKQKAQQPQAVNVSQQKPRRRKSG